MRFIKPSIIFVFSILLGTGCSTPEKTYQKTRQTMANLFNAAEDTYRPALGLDRDIDLQFVRHHSIAGSMPFRNFI